MSAPGRRHGRTRSVVRAVTIASAGVLACGATLLATSAQAAYQEVPETGTPGHLVLLSDPYPAAFLDLEPGVVRYWQVAATIEGADEASLVLELRKEGALVDHPDGLVVSIERCDTAWTGVAEGDPQCASGRTAVARATPDDDFAASSPVFDLEGVDSDGTHLLVALGLAGTDTGDESLMGLTGDVGLGLTAAADDRAVPVPQDPPAPPIGLPVTGADPIGLILAALGAMGLGVALVASRTRRSPALRTVRSEGAAQLAAPGMNLAAPGMNPTSPAMHPEEDR